MQTQPPKDRMMRRGSVHTREAGRAQAPLAASSNTENVICRRSTDAINFWREQAAAQPNVTGERFWALTLDTKRRFTGGHLIAARSLADSQKFATELFAADFFRGVPEFVLIHHRPGIAPEAGPRDVERVRAVILSGRSRKIGLLDCLIIGQPNEKRPSGIFSFYRMRGFSAQIPFQRPPKRQSNSDNPQPPVLRSAQRDGGSTLNR